MTKMKIKNSYLYILWMLSLTAFATTSVVNAAKFSLEPSEGEFVYNCPFAVDIMMDTEGVETNTSDVSILTDDSVFAVNKFDPEGWLFPSYTSPIKGKARHGEFKGRSFVYIAGTTASKKTIEGKGKFGTLIVTPLAGVKTMDLEFYMIPWTAADDSNITYTNEDDKIIDALSEVMNGIYKFKKGECDSPYLQPIAIDDQAPSIVNNEDVSKGEIVDTDTDIKEPTDTTDKPTITTDFLSQNMLYIVIIIVVLILIIILTSIKKKKSKK